MDFSAKSNFGMHFTKRDGARPMRASFERRFQVALRARCKPFAWDLSRPSGSAIAFAIGIEAARALATCAGWGDEA